MSYFMIDVEADGPCPGEYSMIALGAVHVRPPFEAENEFVDYIKPITARYNQPALAVSGFTREDTLKFNDPEVVMTKFLTWVKEQSVGNPIFVSDNNGFDWQFVNYYFWRFLGENPFGHSSINLNSYYKGLVCDNRKSFKHLRKTKHTHNPLDDAKGNAEALIEIVRHFNPGINLLGEKNDGKGNIGNS